MFEGILKRGDIHLILKFDGHPGLTIQAVNGCVLITDQKTGEETLELAEEMKWRAKMLHREAKKIYLMPESYRKRLNDYYNELTKATCSIADVYQQCKEQGDPTDPETIKMIRQTRRKSALVLG